MNILFLTKFFTPFDRGGSEWSTQDLASLLTKDGHLVTVVTPNYGTQREVTIDGIKIIRIPFPIKLANPKDSPAPYWTNNVIWFVYSTLFCLYLTFKNRYHVIHIQNNEFLPAAVITAKILRKKTVATFRDYQAVCNLGFCLWHGDQAVPLRDYLEKEFGFFYENYVEDKNFLKYYLLKLAALRGWFIQKILYIFASRVDYKIAVSQKVAAIFAANGIKNLKVIHNPIIINKKLSSVPQNKILYVGKLSKGKGVDILLSSLPGITAKLKGVTFEIIGSGHLREKLETFVKDNGLGEKVIFRGHLSHDAVLENISKSALVVVPSVWPEPLPRSVIEALLSTTPVVAASIGGIGEIVKNNRYGILTSPNKTNLQSAIVEAFQRKDLFKNNIRKDLASLKNHFSKDSVKLYEAVYKEATL